MYVSRDLLLPALDLMELLVDVELFRVDEPVLVRDVAAEPLCGDIASPVDFLRFSDFDFAFVPDFRAGLSGGPNHFDRIRIVFVLVLVSSLSAQYPSGNQTHSYPSFGGRGGSVTFDVRVEE